MANIQYFSMFSGIGGFEYGIERAFDNEYAHISEESEQEERSQGRFRAADKQGVQLHDRNRTTPLCVGYSEIDKYAIKVYERHFKHDNKGDATNINPKELPDFDLLVGGFPCQAFSIAGKRAGFNDTRGTLFFDIARICAEKRPRHLVLENVKGLLSHDQGKTFQTILGVLADLGYFVEWQVLNSKDFGVPQNRERVFIVGYLGGEPRRKVFPITGTNTEDTQLHPTLDANYYKGYSNQRRMIRQLNQPKHSNDRVYDQGGISPTLNTAQGGNRQPFIAPVLTPDRAVKRQNGRRFKTDGEPAFTVNTQDRHGIYNGARIRRLTPLECERLQGFPDGWTEGLSDTQRYKTLGNAVTTNVVENVMKGLTPCLTRIV